MSSISGIGSRAREDIEVESNAVAAPSTPKTAAAKAKGTGASGSTNQLVDGSHQRAPAPSAKHPSPEDMNAIREALRTGITDWSVSDAEVAQVSMRLEAMSPAQYREAVELMSSEDLLGGYLKKSGWEGREAFFEQAERKGLIKVEHGKMAQGPLNPPNQPDLYVNDDRLPVAMRRALHENAIDRHNGYAAAYDDYQDRYAAAVKQVRSGEELRELGAPARIFSVGQPGVMYGDPYYEEFTNRTALKAKASITDSVAQQAISDQAAFLRREARGGTLFVEGKLEVEAHGKKIGGEARMYLDDRAPLETKTSGGIKSDGIENSVEVDHKAEKTFGFGVDLDPAKLGVKVGTDGELKEVEAELYGTGAKLTRDGTELKVGLPGAFHSKSFFDSKKGDFGGGVGVEQEIAPGIKVKAEGSLGMKGLSKDAALHSIDSKGIFIVPDELTRGIRWDALPEQSRATHARNLWTADEWNSRIDSNPNGGR